MTDEDIENIVKNKVQNGYGFDPMTIMAIISAAIYIFKIIRACKQAQSLLKSSAKRKGLAYRIFVQKNFLNKMRELNVDDVVAEEILEELRLKYIAS
jgi:predicted amidophosphoribosyltransferase